MIKKLALLLLSMNIAYASYAKENAEENIYARVRVTPIWNKRILIFCSFKQGALKNRSSEFFLVPSEFCCWRKYDYKPIEGRTVEIFNELDMVALGLIKLINPHWNSMGLRSNNKFEHEDLTFIAVPQKVTL